MRQWTYSWNSSDGLRHEGELYAADKDAAYAELRKRGIRPIRVTERIVPVVRRGIRGLRKRDVICIVVAAFAFAAFAWIVSARSVKKTALTLESSSIDSITSNPIVREELRKVVEERAVLAKEYRERYVQRVKKGTLSKEEANELFRAMGLEELK